MACSYESSHENIHGCVKNNDDMVCDGITLISFNGLFFNSHIWAHEKIGIEKYEK